MLSIVVAVVLLPAASPAAASERPNILWITCEDMSPNLGCYGDAYSRSPTIDRLAAEGVRYTNCYTHIGVCAPSRSGIITGMYPPSIGSHAMRSTTVLPPYVRCFSELLRDGGYYCTNNSKTDYNFPVPKTAWDENGNRAHWKNRPEGRPFFAVFNLTVTHESQIRAPEKQYEKNTVRLTPDERHDPALAPLPPYHPDTPLVRRDWARYYDDITAMDYQVADLLKELDDAGLADDTIVFFYSDHGAGMPRSKRWLYDSSVRVPLIIRTPPRWRSPAAQPGAVDDRLVAFVDLAPTALSLGGVPIPKHMQGQAFLGSQQAAAPREYVYGCRDRMDERVDLIRSVRDRRYKYIRNYQWWQPYAQNINYMNEMPTMQEWRRLHAAGRLDAVQSQFMAPQKPREELYDCLADPHEVKNLAEDPAQAEVLIRLRAAHERWVAEVRDYGLLPEVSLQTFLRSGSGWRENVEMHNAVQRIHGLWLTQFDPEWRRSNDPKSMVSDVLAVKAARDYGPGMTALRIRCAEFLGDPLRDMPGATDMLLQGVRAAELPVRIAAAQSLVKLRRSADGGLDEATRNLAATIYREGLAAENAYVRHAAVLAVDDLGPAAAALLDEVRAMLKVDDSYAARVWEYLLKTRTP